MNPRLDLCPGCGRHVFSDAEQCPFCGQLRKASAAPSPSPMGVAAAVVVSGALLVGCSSGQPDTNQPTGEPPPDATAVAMYGAPAPSSDERVPDPTPTAEPTSSEQAPPAPPPVAVYGPPPKQDDNR